MSGELQGVDLVYGEHSGFHFRFVALSGDESSAKSSHNTGNVRADGLTARDTLKAAQYCIIVKSSALNDDVFAQFSGIGYLYYLI